MKIKQFSSLNICLQIFLAALAFRFFMYLISALILAFQAGEGAAFGWEYFLTCWCKWDANHYINIAEHGYAGAVEDGKHLFLVFFPLYPYLMSFLHLIFSDIRFVGMLISTVAYAGGCVYMYRLIRLDYSERTAWNSIILLSLFPFSFFYGGIMTEGVFLLISAAMLYYIRQHRWWTAVGFGILATMTRMQGVLLAVPAAVELLILYDPVQMVRKRDFSKLKSLLGRGCSFLLMFLGTAFYMLINWRVEGDPFRFLYYQKNHWSQGACLPTRTVSYLFEYAFFSDDYDLQTRISLWIPQAVLFLVSVAILIYGIRKLRAFYMGYAAAYVLMTFSATWLLSAGRYLSCCIPLFLILGAAGEKRKWVVPVLAAASAMLQIIYLTGFMNNMQIM